MNYAAFLKIIYNNMMFSQFNFVQLKNNYVGRQD
jgi:hypothetical protein